MTVRLTNLGTGETKEFHPKPNGTPSQEPEQSDSPMNPAWADKIVSAAHIKANPPPPTAWDVDQIIERESGPVLWYGDSGSFKSFLALHVAACVATGEAVFGHFATKRRPNVYYVNMDAGRVSFERRVVMLPDPPVALNIISAEAFDIEKLDFLFEEYRNAFFVLDCWSDMYDPDATAEQGADMRQYVRAIRSRFEAYKANGIIIDHTKKAQPRSILTPAEAYYGSTQKRATFRQMTHIGTVHAGAQDERSHRVKLSCTKLSEAEAFKPFFVDVTFADGLYRCTYAGLADGESERRSKAQEDADKIVEQLRKVFPESQKPDELARSVGLERNSRAFRDAVNEELGGRIERLGEARATRYRLLDGRSLLPQADIDALLS